MTVTVVVPLDGSIAAESAIPFANTLAERRSAPVMLTSVVEVTEEFATWLNTGVDDSDREIGAWVEDRRIYLKSLIDSMRGSDVHAHVSVGRPTNMLIEFIHTVEAPIVVMASHGREHPEKGAIGRHTLRLLHHLNAPVVVVKNAEDGGIPLDDGIRRVLVPLDGSQFAESGLDAALTVLGDPVPSIHLVSVIEHTGSFTGASASPFADDFLQSARDEHAQHLDRHAHLLTERGHVITWEVRAGVPEIEIAAAAVDSHASMIAMATHGRSGTATTLLGSVTEGVLHHSRHPLLLVRPEGE